MRVVLGTLIRRYSLTLDPRTTNESMAPQEHFFVTPAAMGKLTALSARLSQLLT